MKLALRLAFLMINIAGLSFAENSSENQPMHHSKKVFMDTTNHKLYWPKNKPVWIRLAESAEPDAPSYLLSPDSSGNKAASGIMLDKSGIQTLRWFNKVKGDTVRFRFVCDGEGPECVLRSPHRLPFGPKRKMWFGTNMEEMIDSWDNLSGVDSVFISFDNFPFKPISSYGPKDLSEKWKTCSFYAIDKVGNPSPIYHENVSFDLTPPQTCFQTAIASDSLFSKKTQIRLYSKDSLSGVAEILFRFDSASNWTKQKDIVRFTGLSDGAHSLEYYAIDNAGNKEKPQVLRFLIDNNAPTITVACSSDCYKKDDTHYWSGTSIVYLEAKDSISGVADIQFAVDNGRFTAYAFPLKAAQFGAGLHKLRVQASDKLGNVKVEVFKICVDAKAPVSRVTVKGPAIEQNGIVYLSTKSALICDAKDDFSGVRRIEWKLGGDTLVYNSPISLTKEGVCTLYCRAVDNVGNAEPFHEFTLALDASPPQLMQMFSRKGVPSNVEDSVTLFQAPLTLYLGATDSLSGLASLFYSINNSSPMRYNQELHFDSPNKYVVGVTATDLLGNTEKKSTVFRVK